MTSKPESVLYGVHGIGSACGAWLAGLVLLPYVGTQITFVVSGIFHFLVALSFLAVKTKLRKIAA